MDRFKASRPCVTGACLTLFAGLAQLLFPVAAIASETAADYSFSRWQIEPPASAEVSPPSGGEASFAAAATVAPTQRFLLPDLDTISLDPDFGRQEMIASGEVFDGGGVGFLGGIDMSTVMIYSSGALLGVVGANIGRDGKDDLSSGSSDPTSYISDPAIFVTDEFENQYGLGAINAQYAYARGHTGDGVLVSVMDTRFNTDHANLSGVFVEGYNVVSDDTVVDSGCTGPTNPCLHGTHVAGIIAGNKTDVDTGMHGVAYGAQIKPIPFLEIGITTGQQQVDAFEKASGVDSGTGQQIVAMNNSWGAVAGFHGSTYNSKYFKVPNETTITNLDSVYLGSAAAADNNTILVFAAGNDGWNNETGIVDLFDSTDSSVRSGTALASAIAAESSANISSANRIDTATAMPTYAPDNSSYVIDEAENEYMWLVVVATDDNNTITHFSNACGVAKSYCLAAPGEDIFATNGLNSPAYQTLDGTSMAAPHVTGAIAILADMYPNLVNTPENITQILLETATDLGATGVDDIYGHGLLNLQAATGPLGDITITDSSFGASSQTYDGNAQIITPIAFGDALTKSGVSIGGVDKFDRVFMLDLPVAAAEKMQALALAGRAATSLAPAASDPQVVFGNGLSFTLEPADAEGHIEGAGIGFARSGPAHYLGLHFITGMDPAAPQTSADAPLGYDRYFDAMAHATATRERLSFDASKVTEDGSRMTSTIRLDRDSDEVMTLISRSGYETYLGPVSLGFSLGGMTEEGRILGGAMTGALAIEETHTMLARSQFSLPFFRIGEISGFYELARSLASFTHADLVTADAITSDSYGLSWQHRPRPGSQLVVVLHRPVAVTGGQLGLNTITGYTSGGDYRAETLLYDLAPQARETSLLAEYRREVFNGGSLALGLNHQMNAHNIAGRENTGGFLRGEMQF